MRTVPALSRFARNADASVLDVDPKEGLFDSCSHGDLAARRGPRRASGSEKQGGGGERRGGETERAHDGPCFQAASSVIKLKTLFGSGLGSL